MGRPEKPLDPDAGPVQRLAHELRQLRASAGGLTYRAMACRAHYSATALAQAAAGDRLPSLAVVLAYARVCGADPTVWEDRWREADEAATPHDHDHASAPYRGMARFEPEHQHLFFGRDRVVDDLLQVAREHRFAALVGPSGSGKSSLLRAGLLPALREAARHARHPVDIRLITLGQDPPSDPARLLEPRGADTETWVVVDQTQHAAQQYTDLHERAQFGMRLFASRQPESRLRVIVSIRPDFQWLAPSYRPWIDGWIAAMQRHTVVMPAMGSTELREAIVRPAIATGLIVERELTARLIDDVLGRPNALPMLSHALLETWRRRRGRVLTLADYQAVGGAHGAIAATAEQVYGRLTDAQARTARQVLLRLIAPGDGTPDTRRPVHPDELRLFELPDTRAVLDALVEARLVIMDGERLELAHEALITQWPRLGGWLEQERERLLHRRHLTETARAWQRLGHDHGDFYRGKRLSLAAQLFPPHAEDDELTPVERAFLNASLAAHAATAPPGPTGG
ncbi:helix-turn-helix domain-containing protein [Streptacidiphilus sp. EB103A]|uniref:nSTAND1 domain-containing NTPase n=1 Tax=Streptacidiphilus sp. EB103A TaxID=3156275 RepID=UPI0035184C7C